MFDFVSDPAFLIMFAGLMLVAFLNGLFWASGRPALMKIASPWLLLIFFGGVAGVVQTQGWLPGLVCIPAGLLVAAGPGMTLGRRLLAAPSGVSAAASAKPAETGAAADGGA